MRSGCHSLIFGALQGPEALAEVARAGFECAVLAEIEGQATHASQLTGAPHVPLGALDVAAHEPQRVRRALEHATRLGVSTVLITAGGRQSDLREVVVPRTGTAVWNAVTALSLVHQSPEIRLWPDTSHLARSGDDLPEAARALAPYATGWFIRDHDEVSPGPGSFESQVPGRGALALSEVLRVLQDQGFSGPIVFHAVGHLPGGRLRNEYPLDRLRALAREARDYLSAYCTSSADRPT